MLFYLNKVLALGLTFILKYVSCRSRYKRQHFPQHWFMGRVNFNGIVISLQSIVVHGAGGLKKPQGVSINRSSASLPVFWSLQRVLGECFLLFFFHIYSQKCFFLGVFTSFFTAWSELPTSPSPQDAFWVRHPMPCAPRAGGDDDVSAGCHTHSKGSKIMAHGLLWCISLFSSTQRKRLSLHLVRTSSSFVSFELLKPTGLCTSFPPLKAKKQLCLFAKAIGSHPLWAKPSKQQGWLMHSMELSLGKWRNIPL